MDPATPDVELSNDITIGMSAPPTLIENNIPKAVDKVKIRYIQIILLVDPDTTNTAAIKLIIKLIFNNIECPLITIGLPSIFFASLRAATTLPTNVTTPINIASIPVIATNLSYIVIDIIATIALASPPNAFNKATVCGISIIVTFIAI